MTAHLSHTVTRGGQIVLRATGELDVATAPGLRRAVDTVVRAGGRRLVLDLTTVDFVDATVVDVVVGRLRALRRIGGDLVVAVAHERVARPFTATQADQVLALVPSVADARDITELEVERARRRSATGRRQDGARKAS